MKAATPDSLTTTQRVNLRSTASTGKTRSRRLAAKLHVQAAESNLSGASKTVGILVDTAVHAAESTAESNVLLVDSVVTTSAHDCK